MKNQWGQEIHEGDIVSYVNKTGSFTERKLGTVTTLTTRTKGYRMMPAVCVDWKVWGSYGSLVRPSPYLRDGVEVHKSTVGVNTVVVVAPESLSEQVREWLA